MKLSAVDKLNLALKDEKKPISKKEKLELIKNISINLSDSEEENLFLESKTKEALNIQANASLELGRVFSEVAEKIEDRTYCNWLEIIGFNRTTAFRHRRRHELFLMATKESTKEIIASLTFRELEIFYKNKEDNIKLIDESEFTLNEVKNYLSGLQETSQKLQIVSKEIHNLVNYNLFKNINIEEKIEKLDEKKQEEVNDLLTKLQKIFENL